MNACFHGSRPVGQIRLNRQFSYIYLLENNFGKLQMPVISFFKITQHEFLLLPYLFLSGSHYFSICVLVSNNNNNNLLILTEQESLINYGKMTQCTMVLFLYTDILIDILMTKLHSGFYILVCGSPFGSANFEILDKSTV